MVVRDAELTPERVVQEVAGVLTDPRRLAEMSAAARVAGHPEADDVLARIAAYKREEIAAAQARTPLAELRRRVADGDRPRGFGAAIARRLAPGGTALIAETLAGQAPDLPVEELCDQLLGVLGVEGLRDDAVLLAIRLET